MEGPGTENSNLEIMSRVSPIHVDELANELKRYPDNRPILTNKAPIGVSYPTSFMGSNL